MSDSQDVETTDSEPIVEPDEKSIWGYITGQGCFPAIRIAPTMDTPGTKLNPIIDGGVTITDIGDGEQEVTPGPGNQEVWVRQGADGWHVEGWSDMI